MSQAVYRIGPSDFFTPDDLAADALTLNGQVNGLNNANWDRPTQETFDAFQQFVSEWRAFYSSSFGGFFRDITTALNNANRDQLIQFEERLAVFIGKYEQEAGRAAPGAVVAPSTGSKDTFGDHLRNQLQPFLPQWDIRWVGLALAGVAVVFYFRAPILRAINSLGAK